jgi:exodeoxyribonuclease V alpha subunit
MAEAFSRLLKFRSAELFTNLDLQLAQLMSRLARDDSWELAVAVALVSNLTTRGHVCLELKEWSGRVVLDGEGSGHRLPEYQAWFEKLKSCSVVADPGGYHPLVLDRDGRLYLYRYWNYERLVAQALVERSRADVPATDFERLSRQLNNLFPDNPGSEIDWQKAAAALTVLKPLGVISGGPGTGKTTTVVKILALLQSLSSNPRAIALAAPTGKAAARLEDAVRGAKNHLSLERNLLDTIPEKAVTLHRLLGGGHGTVHFRHDENNPLPVDVVVLDESSMVDLPMMSKLLGAMPKSAKLVLLGDMNQLASVESGAVLGDICRPWKGFSRRQANQLAELTGDRRLRDCVGEGNLSDSIVVLQHSHRFGADSGIGNLAEAVNQGEAERTLSILRSDQYGDVYRFNDVDELIEHSLEGYSGYLALLQQGAGIEALYQAFEQFRVLCAVRAGERGVEQLNLAIIDALESRGINVQGETWFHGRAVMISRNDYTLHLYNGDVGIALEDGESGSLSVWFPGNDGGFRAFSPMRLPEHETVFAMTVHKSQGSEFDRVLLVLPQHDNPVLSRELLYTGITRARKACSLCADESMLGETVRKSVSRSSGLGERLWPRLPDQGQMQLPGL